MTTDSCRTGAHNAMRGAGMTGVDCLAILYLALPVALFFVTWFRPIFGIPLGLMAFAGLIWILPLRSANLPLRTLLFAAILALSWVALSGASHFFYAGGSLNWPIRDAALRDLVLMANPVTYRLENDAATILRAPLAYYVVPALIAKAIGVKQVFFLLYLWTALGVGLFLLQMLERQRGWAPLLLTAAVVVLFSGMDLLGPQGDIVDPLTNQTWVPFFYQSTYNANLLIGFPNHAIPGWLAAALIYRCSDDPKFLSIAAWLGALTLLWAPLVSIGLLPFFVVLGLQHWRSGGRRALFSVCNLVAAPLVAAPSVLYLTVGAGTIAAVGTGTAVFVPDWQAFLPVYARFMVVEFGALSLALIYAHRDRIDPVFLGVAVLCLLALPWFHFGPNNDLVNRGAIPAMAVILFTVIDGLIRPMKPFGRGLAVLIILAIGAVLPIARMGLVFSRPAGAPDFEHSLYDVTNGSSPNYLADIDRKSLLARLLGEARRN